MNLKIIEADVSHSAVIATIGKYSFRKALGHLFFSKTELFEYLEYTYDPVKIVKSLRKGNNVYLLGFADDRPVGFAKVKIHSLNDSIESVAQMELQKIYVLPEYHGNGVGSALMNEVKRLASDIHPDYLWLDTHLTNEKAIRFYERNGFEKIGKQFFTIGLQTFEYHIMAWPVAMEVSAAY